MKGTSRRTKCMAKVHTNGQMVGCIKETSSTTRKMALASTTTQMADGLKVIGKMDFNMEMAHSLTPRVTNSPETVSGKMGNAYTGTKSKTNKITHRY